MWLLFGGFFLLCSLPLFRLWAVQIPEVPKNNQESSEVVLMIAGKEHRYQSRPDLGYVIMAQENADTIASVKSNFDLFTRQDVKYIGGRGRQRLRIIESEQSATQRRSAIQILNVQKHYQYVAPLFSCNGSKIAVIPEIVVRVTSGIHMDQLQSLCRKIGCDVIKPMEFTTQEYLLGVQGPNAETVFEAVNELNRIEWIEWAAPNIVFSPKPCGQVIPNDEYFSMQWHLHNTGEFVGKPNADINAPEAWEITTGDPNIVVAVVDTGVDLDHPDLVNNLVPGYDFHNNDDLPEPTNNAQAHGTACAGLIAAEGNNSIGVTGVTWKCKIMPIRAYMWGNWGATPESQIATAVRWAATHGADIISNSWEDNIPLPIVRSAFADVTQPGGLGRNGKGCIALAAAGNQGNIVHTPAAHPEVIAVGATDADDIWYSYSNFGPELDVVAPSGDWWDNRMTVPQWTTDIAGSAGYNSDNTDPSILDYTDAMSGTSGACPIVAGVSALILSIEPDLTSNEVRHFLERSAKDLGEPGRDDYYGWGRVDARAALDMVLAKRCDLNNDWKVDDQDIDILNMAIDTNDLSADIAPAAKRDGIVDEHDLELLMQYLDTEIPEIGLIAHWNLDETEGNIAYENVHGKDGSLHGAPLWQPVNGQVDGALEFDGIDDYVSTNFALNPANGPFSVFAWIKGGAPGQVILSQESGVNWFMADSVDGALKTDLKQPGTTGGRNPSPPGPPLISSTNITDGDWHRLGFVWDASYRHLYVDGAEVAMDVASLSGLETAEGSLYFGAGGTLSTGTFFSGLIDDIRIYNQAIVP